MTDYENDILNAAQNRRRTGRSFFPAANYSNGQTLIPSRYGTSSAVLPPDQNPAYQAAISKPRPNMDNYSWITTPSGGQMRVPNASLGNLLRQGTDLAGSTIQGTPVSQASLQPSVQDPTKSVAYMSGYLGGQGGALSSVGRTGTGFAPALPGYRSQGGVQTPLENLSPQERAGAGVGSAFDYLRAGPASLAVQNLVSGFGANIANWFRPQPQRYSDATPPRDYFNPTSNF